MREHVTSARVRYGETDKMGVVYHAGYIVYFELGRTELLRDAGLAYADIEKKGYRLVVTEAGAKYRAAVHYDDVIEIHTRVTELGRVRIRFDYRILRGADLAAEGHTLLACLDDSGKPARLPSEILERLKEWAPGPRPQ